MTGYRGRAGLYELLTLDGETQSALHPQIDIEALRKLRSPAGLAAVARGRRGEGGAGHDDARRGASQHAGVRYLM